MKISFNITTINRKEIEKSQLGDVNYLSKCLESLLNDPNASKDDFIINIFDDGSKDTYFIYDAVEDFYNIPINIYHYKENVGIFHNINRLFEQSMKQDVDWVFIIQDDSVFMENSMTAIDTTLQKIPDNGIIASYLALYPQNHNKKWNRYPRRDFYCFCCTGFRKDVIELWLDSDHVEEDRNQGGDIVIPRYLCQTLQKKFKIYKWGTNFATHGGRWSTVQGQNKWKKIDDKTRKIQKFGSRNALEYI